MEKQQNAPRKVFRRVSFILPFVLAALGFSAACLWIDSYVTNRVPLSFLCTLFSVNLTIDRARPNRGHACTGLCQRWKRVGYLRRKKRDAVAMNLTRTTSWRLSMIGCTLSNRRRVRVFDDQHRSLKLSSNDDGSCKLETTEIKTKCSYYLILSNCIPNIWEYVTHDVQDLSKTNIKTSQILRSFILFTQFYLYFTQRSTNDNRCLISYVKCLNLMYLYHVYRNIYRFPYYINDTLIECSIFMALYCKLFYFKLHQSVTLHSGNMI